MTESITASADEVLASEIGTHVVYEEQTQYDNFFKPNVIAFDFAVDSHAVNGVIEIEALSDLDHPSESVAYNIEGIVTGELWTGADNGVRPFTATIDLNDADLAAIAADGNLHIEFTPNTNVDDFGNVSEYVTVGLTYGVARTPISLKPVSPTLMGSYRGSAAGVIDTSTQKDTYTIELEAGQTFRYEAVPSPDMRLSMQVFDPTGAVMSSLFNGSAGAPMLVPVFTANSTGTYSITVGSISGQPTGSYGLTVYVNEDLEQESRSKTINNNAPSISQNLDSIFRDLGGDMHHAVLRGSTTAYVAHGNPADDISFIESFEGGVLPAGWTANTSNGSRVLVTDQYGAAAGSYALLMDNKGVGSNLNEAIWNLDLNNDHPATLSFAYAEWGDATQSLPASFVGSYNGDGVSISEDGITWHRVLNAWDSPSGVWIPVEIDLSQAAANAGIRLGPDFKIKFQQYDLYALNSPSPDGRGYDNVRINTTQFVQRDSPAPDFYSFTLGAGDLVSIDVMDTDADPVALKLYDVNQSLIDDIPITIAGGRATITDFWAETAGTYYIEVGSGRDDYLLSILRNGTTENENNHGLLSAQPLGQTGRALGVVDTAGPPDYYAIPVIAGDTLVFETTTPNGGASGLNTMDPQLRLYGPAGILLASDLDGAADGRNALLSYQATEIGDYYVEVLSTTGEGLYTLRASGFTGSTSPTLSPVGASVADGSAVTRAITSISVTFNQDLMQAIDLSNATLNGTPVVSATLDPNGRTVVFFIDPASLVEGANTFILSAGAVSNLQGDANEPFTANFIYDITPPKIIESSIHEGDVLYGDQVTLTLKFSEPVYSPGLLTGEHTSLRNASDEDSIFYNESTNELTVTYSGDLPEGEYWFILDDEASGLFIRDASGNILDGEINTSTTTPSGDGIEGGRFLLYFALEDGESQPLEFSNITPIGPKASFAYEGTFSNRPVFVGNEDRYAFDLEVGETFSFYIDEWHPLIELETEIYDPVGNLLAVSLEDPLSLYNIHADTAGTYTLLIRCISIKYNPIYSNSYTGHLQINASHEDEPADGHYNDNIASAESIDSRLSPLGDGVEQAVILGQLPYDPYADSFETGTYSQRWQLYRGGEGGNAAASDMRITDDFGGADGQYALVMTTNYTYYYSLNEATWTVDLAGFDEAVLSFSHREWNDDRHLLPASFAGHYSGDGVAISSDGITWYTLLNAPDEANSNWYNYEFDLVAAASNAGIALGQDFKIRFQQFDNGPVSSAGRAYDNIRITSTPEPTPAYDIYSIDLLAGQALSLALDSGKQPVALELLDPTGQLLTVGQAGDWSDVTELISGFAATTAGRYYIRVTGYWDPYTLIVTRGATYTPQATDSTEIIELGPSGKSVSAYLADTTDNYSFFAESGSNLVIWTTTPSFNPLAPENNLDTYLELIGPDGLTRIASETGGDGLNARLDYVADQAGKYLIKLYTSDGASTGEYILHVNGHTGSPLPLTADTPDFEEGQHYTTVPTGITVQFSDSIRLDSLGPSDLILNGAPAVSVEVLDGSTVFFNFETGFVQGVNSLTLEDGSIMGLDDRPVLEFSRQFTLDTIAPRIISSSMTSGDFIEPGRVFLSFTFDELLETTGLNASDIQISASQYYPRPSIDYFDYDPDTSVLTIGFDAVYEGAYVLTLYDSGLTDPAGNRLDGENPGTDIPAGVSGDGVAGGNFVLPFTVDRTSNTDINSPATLKPSGSLVYLSLNEGVLNYTDDIDMFNVFVETGQTVTARISTRFASSQSIYLDGPNGTTAQSGPNEPTFLSYTNEGPGTEVSFSVYGDVLDAPYTLEIYFNATLESSLSYLPASGNDSYDLTGLWQSAPGSYGTVTVIGNSQHSYKVTATGIQSPTTRYLYFNPVTAPTGDGILTVTAMGDLEDISEYLTISSEGYYSQQVFAQDGLEGVPITTTLTIPQAALEAMAADGSIRFDVKGSGAVGSYTGSFVTLDLDYPGLPGPRYDSYAIDLGAGQVFNAYLDPTDTGFEMVLIDTETDLSVASSSPDYYADPFSLDYVATHTGRFDLRIYAAGFDEYRLTMHRDTVFDGSFIDTPAATPISLDNATGALGALRSPGPEALLAVRGVQLLATLYTLDPHTFELIEQFWNVSSASPAGVAAITDIAYDGAYIFASRPGSQVQVIDPSSGTTIDTIDLEYQGSVRGISYNNGELVTLVSSSDTVSRVLFINPQSGNLIRQLDLPYSSGTAYYALAGTGSRGTLFITTRENGIYYIDEYEALTGQRVNRFSYAFSSAAKLAYVDGTLFLYDYGTRTIYSHDPDSGQLLASHTFPTSSTSGIIVSIGGNGLAPRIPVDRYAVTLKPGDSGTLWTETPFDNSAAIPLNNLDPAIRLLDPLGNLVAFNDDGAPDGKNASLTFTANVAGIYTIEVQAVTGSGVYRLKTDFDRVLPGDVTGDGFVGIEDLNTVLSNWNQNVAVGNLAQGDASGDGFVGIEDLNAVLGNWNATLEPPAVEGDLNSDGFVGITDLNVVLGNWNQSVIPSDLTQGDPSGDGFVGIEDLNTVLGNWNTGIPAAVEAFTLSGDEPLAEASAFSADDTTIVTELRHSMRNRSGDNTGNNRSHYIHNPSVAAAWDYLNRRSTRADNPAFTPWSLRPQEESPLVGLWEEERFGRRTKALSITSSQ